MPRRFQQIQAEERMALAAMRPQGMSLRAIGSALGRSPDTLSRELLRNSSGGAYAIPDGSEELPGSPREGPHTDRA